MAAEIENNPNPRATILHEYPDFPRVAVGAVVVRNHQVLLVLRGKPPAEGEWSIPGGSVELGESFQAAAEREIWEETGIRIRTAHLLHAFDSIVRDRHGRIRFHYVILDVMGTYVSGTPRPGDDVRDARWIRAATLYRYRLNPGTCDLLRRIGFSD